MAKVRFYIKEKEAEKSDEMENAELFPLLDIFENQGKIHIQVELPGIIIDDLDLSVKGNEVTVKAFKKDETIEKKDVSFVRMERKFGWFKKTVKLPVPCDTNSVKAFYSKGILSIIFKKVENKRGVEKKITIE